MVWQILVYGNYLFSCSWDKEVIMWATKVVTIVLHLIEQTLTMVQSFVGHSQHVYCMCIEDNVLYTGSGDWTVRSWDLFVRKF